mgnify:CR=1 FL=1
MNKAYYVAKLLELSILYLRCRSHTSPMRRPVAPRLSILYLRCTYDAYDCPHSDELCELSILYLRCMPKFVRYQPLEGGLSILYLRCEIVRLLPSSKSFGNAFNSLFEMQKVRRPPVTGVIADSFQFSI